MNNSQLDIFRAISDAMQTEPATWQWTGPFISQRMFGITKSRALDYQSKFGGDACEMRDAYDLRRKTAGR